MHVNNPKPYHTQTAARFPFASTGGQGAGAGRTARRAAPDVQRLYQATLCRDDAAGSGWNGQPGRSRRQPAAEFRHSQRSNASGRTRRTNNGGRVARRNGPVARSTRTDFAPSLGLTPSP